MESVVSDENVIEPGAVAAPPRHTPRRPVPHDIASIEAVEVAEVTGEPAAEYPVDPVDVDEPHYETPTEPVADEPTEPAPEAPVEPAPAEEPVVADEPPADAPEG